MHTLAGLALLQVHGKPWNRCAAGQTGVVGGVGSVGGGLLPWMRKCTRPDLVLTGLNVSISHQPKESKVVNSKVGKRYEYLSNPPANTLSELLTATN